MGINMKIYANHIGFEQSDYKTAVLETKQEITTIEIRAEGEDGARFPVNISKPHRIVEWSDACYYILEFSHIRTPGNYRIAGTADGIRFRSEVIPVTGYSLHLRMVNAARTYFKGERASGEWLKADRKVPFDGKREGLLDLHGGWYDATGDFGVHLTQLSHTAVYNPMQSLLPSYVCFDIAERIEKEHLRDCRILKKELLDEAYWGADYAMRLYREGGSFIRSVDRGEAFGEKQNRKIDYEYFRFSGHEEDQSYLAEEIQDKNYETGLRSGAGLAVAALAQAARSGGASGEYACEEYLHTAQKAFSYILENNEKHISDGVWNFLDWYCGLAAAVELYKTTGKEEYLEKCRYLEKGMEKYLIEMEEGIWFTSRGKEMYFHPSDEGFPLLLLIKYAESEPRKDHRKRVTGIVKKAFGHLISISESPFGYAAFTWKKEEKETNRYFFPHDTKAAPWWQGENGRIASLAAAALKFSRMREAEEVKDKLIIFAGRQLNWIMGCNPFDSCMIEGFGRNNIQYFYKNQYNFINSPGGICNGITAGENNDSGIEFIMEPSENCDDNWRWAEQWLPCAAWYLYAEGWKLL